MYIVVVFGHTDTHRRAGPADRTEREGKNMKMYEKWIGNFLYYVMYKNGHCYVTTDIDDKIEFRGTFNQCVQFINELFISYEESLF